VASLSQGRTAAAQCGLFTHKSVPVIFEPPCISVIFNAVITPYLTFNFVRLFAALHIILNHKTTTLTSNNLNCYSALPCVSQRTGSSHHSDIPKAEYVSVRH